MTFKNRSLGFNVASWHFLATGPNFPTPGQAVDGGTEKCVNHPAGGDIFMDQQVGRRSESGPNPGYIGNFDRASLGCDEATGLAWLEVLAFEL
eukprot:s166_g19.t1